MRSRHVRTALGLALLTCCATRTPAPSTDPKDPGFRLQWTAWIIEQHEGSRPQADALLDWSAEALWTRAGGAPPRKDERSRAWVDRAIAAARSKDPSFSNDLAVELGIRAMVSHLVGARYDRLPVKDGGPPTAPVTPSVRVCRISSGVLYVRLVQVDPLGASVVKHVADGLKTRDVVLDLRGLGSEDYTSAFEIADLFIFGGEILMLETKRPSQSLVASPGTSWLEGAHAAILVDEGTWGAAEWLAAALQDRGHARVVGRKTEGRADLVSRHDLPDSGRLTLVSAHVLRPSRKPITGVGVSPDVIVEPGRVASRQPEEVRCIGSGEDSDLGRDPVVLAGLSTLLTAVWPEAAATATAPSGAIAPAKGALSFREGMERPVRLNEPRRPPYPPALQGTGASGLEIVVCTLTENGSAADCQVIKSMGPQFDEVVLRWLAGGIWKPCQIEGHPVACRYVFNFKFREGP